MMDRRTSRDVPDRRYGGIGSSKDLFERVSGESIALFDSGGVVIVIVYEWEMREE